MTVRAYAPALGSQLRHRRKLLRLNQTEVAELAGTTQRTVSKVESGNAAGIELYLAIASVLGLEIKLQPHDEQAPPRTSSGETPR